MPIQSLTLAIWGAYRTLDGPGFEPLIIKASKLISFDGKESPGGIFCNGSLKRRGVAGCVRESPACRRRRGPVRMGCAGAPFQAAASGRRSGMGGGVAKMAS